MGSGGYRPEASQNDPYSVSPNGGNGQSGKFVAEKVAKATQLRPSGFAQGENTAMAQQISEGGNVSTTASAANPASQLPQAGMGADMAQLLGAIEPLDSEPTEFRPVSDGIDGFSGRGSEALPPSLNNAGVNVMQWMENTFFDHLDKFGNSLGYENFGIAFMLSMVPWESPTDRDNFIRDITGQDVKGGEPSNFNPEYLEF